MIEFILGGLCFTLLDAITRDSCVIVNSHVDCPLHKKLKGFRKDYCKSWSCKFYFNCPLSGIDKPDDKDIQNFLKVCGNCKKDN